MSAAPIIALHGFAQSGKDTAAGFLKDEGYERLAFADTMREAMYRLNPEIRVYDDYWRLQDFINLHGWDYAKVRIPEVRRLLQVYGTEVGRGLYGETFWVDQVIRQIRPEGKYVITDVRFPNEYQGLADHYGGDVLFVKVKRLGYGPVNSHVSDAGLHDDLFDRLIVNDGPLEEYRVDFLAAVGII